MRKIELLSPAGNFECLKAAVNNGANAVYLGGKNFSARAFANNFDEEELIRAIEYAHLHNVRIFVTLNTLLTENELNNAVKMADFYYHHNVDALLIQDLGLYYILKEKYPDFELHCSTQMHVHNVEGVITAKKLGFKRVVLARESDIDLIRQACKQGIEVETFVHGAICVSYSGQCLMSSSSKNRSANKGMCAQCCRLKYSLFDEHNKRINTDTDYLISPRDMFLINDIPELIEAGVSSFKIEGRMKSAAYVGYATRMYRKAIDCYLEGKSFSLSDDELYNLKVLFNREFTNDLLYDRKNIFGQKTPNHLGVRIGKVISYKDGSALIKLDHDLAQFDGIRINDFGCIVNRLYKNGLLVNKAEKGDTVSIETKTYVKGDVFKTLDHLLEKQIENSPLKKLPLDLSVSLYPGQQAKVKLSCNGLEMLYQSDITVQQAKNAPLNNETVSKQFSKLNDTIYYLEKINVDTKDSFLPVKDLNTIRREAIDAFNNYRLNSFKRQIISTDYETHDLKQQINDGPLVQSDDYISDKDRKYKINYVINKDSQYCSEKDAVISEFGGLLKEYDHKIAYYTLNVCNSYAYEFLMRLGFEKIVLSSELHENEINDLIVSFKKRNNLDIYPYILKKGDRVLMYIKTNPFDRYISDDHLYHLNDGNNEYQIRKNKGLTEIFEYYSSDINTENTNILPLNINS